MPSNHPASLPISIGQFLLPSRSHGPVSLLVIFDEGRIYAQLLNQRVTKADVAKLLRTTEDGVAYLVKKGCLKPLGRPDETKQKLFAANDVLLQMQDSRWLGKVTDYLYQHVEEKNAGRAKRKRSTRIPSKSDGASE